MAGIVNLRLARKAKARAEAEKQSASNRAKFGQTKGERERRQADEERAARQLEQTRREHGDDGAE